MFGWVSRGIQWNRRRRDPWFDARDSQELVVRWRHEIEVIAHWMSNPQNGTIGSRFNAVDKCAELYRMDGSVVARITIKGKGGRPTETVIKTDLPSHRHIHFEGHFPGRYVFQPLNA